MECDMKLITFAGLQAQGHPYTRRHTERLIGEGKFPAPLKLGEGRNGRIAWDETEIVAHYARLAAARKVAA
jgi:predicted DNA-binding transcriptional regulator AlpA